MPETNASTVSTLGLKRFVRNLCVISKKYEEKESARTDLQRQITKLKTTSLAKKTKKYVIEKDIKDLNTKINNVLEKELELLSLGKQDSILIRKLNERIKKLEDHFNIANEKLDFFASGKAMEKPADTLAEDLRIKEMETRYEQLKREGKLSSSDLSRIERKISLLKKKLAGNTLL